MPETTARKLDVPLDLPSTIALKTRLMIVDDSVVARRMIANALINSTEIEIVGSAASAEFALEKIGNLNPHVLTLDIYMPGMSGLDLIPILRERFPALKILIVSTSTTATLDALQALKLSARNFLSKPSDDVSLAQYLPSLKRDLTAKISELMGRSHQAAHSIAIQQSAVRPIIPTPQPVKPVSRDVNRRAPYQILAVGLSTGGPTALATFMAGFPNYFGLPIVIVQHMPPVFTGLLADRLRTQTGFNVVEATDGMLLEPGKAILAPGDFHMRLERRGEQVFVKLDQGPQECSCRPSVDVLFRSVAQIYGRAAIAAVLTGMGQDGLKGAEVMKNLGSYVIVQDEASSVVWGMPGAIANAGLADQVLDVSLMPKAILEKVGN